MGIFNKKNDSDEAVKDDAKTVATAKETGVKNDTKTVSKKKNKEFSIDSQAFRVLVRPLITEKAAAMSELGKYVFEVAEDANKIDVSKAVFEVYGVKPTAVNVVNMLGKAVSRGKIRGRRKDWRKAIVTLPKGKSIDIYEGI